MGLGDILKAGGSSGIVIETSFTPPINASQVTLGPSSPDGSGDSLVMKVLRPKVTVNGVRYAPYGEPLPLWQIGLALAALMIVRRIL